MRITKLFGFRLNNLSLLILLIMLNHTFLFAQNNEEYNSSNLKLALEKLNVLGSVLYVAAHPDDENNALLAYFANGEHLRTGYLSLTRGDGGQNLIGTEQGDLLGVLRTQELLAARRIDGAKQYFSRAIDFGYSKSPKETLEIWDSTKILSDMVWVIRKFKPDVIITRFPGTGEGGHGNHTASEILAAEAFKISSDSAIFPEQLKYVKPWKAKRILWNAWLPILQKRGTNLASVLKIDDGAYNPILGESYSEIAAKARSMHKTQGFGSSGRLGQNEDYFLPIDGQPVKNSLFDGIDLTWKRVIGGEKIGNLLAEANRKFDPSHPEKIIPILLNAFSKMDQLKENYWVSLKKKELVNVIKDCAGIKLEAIASDYSAVPGQSLNVTSYIINRSSLPFILKDVKIDFQKGGQILNYKLADDKLYSAASTITLPKDIPYSQPYWLKGKHSEGDYVINDQRLIGKAENPSPVNATFTLDAEGKELKLTVPVKYKWTDPVKGEEYRQFIIVPPVAINVEDKNYLFSNDKPREVKINLIANEDSISGKIKLNTPANWKITPDEKSFFIGKKDNVITLSFEVNPPAESSAVMLNVEAIIGTKIISQGMISIDYPHIPIQTVFPPASAKLIRLNIKKVINNIGYIMGPGDTIPLYLKELGYNVTMLTNKEIENGDLSKFDAIVTGIRLYNTDDNIAYEQPKLLKYVNNGGTLVVQYNKDFGLVTKDIGPYPFHISAKRVTYENSPVTFLNPQNPLLNFPNKITEDDFKGWVQERGVYFADSWDAKYETVIACNDPGEEPLKGGLLYAKYGKGVFIYTGYVWFRQLPEGIPGANRIFVNLISAGKATRN